MFLMCFINDYRSRWGGGKCAGALSRRQNEDVTANDRSSNVLRPDFDGRYGFSSSFNDSINLSVISYLMTLSGKLSIESSCDWVWLNARIGRRVTIGNNEVCHRHSIPAHQSTSPAPAPRRPLPRTITSLLR